MLSKIPHANITKIVPLEKSFQIYWLKEVDSTNAEAQRRISAGSGDSANLSVLAAESQTAGKGQGDHKWHSLPGDNLTFTIILRYDGTDGSFPPFPANRQKEISDLTAQAVVDYLALHGIKAWIKPPNDIWIEDKKICGLLIKHRVSGSSLLQTIIGIGLNINEKDFPADLPNPTSLAIEAGLETRLNTHSELERFLEIFSNSLKLLEA